MEDNNNSFRLVKVCKVLDYLIVKGKEFHRQDLIKKEFVQKEEVWQGMSRAKLNLEQSGK